MLTGSGSAINEYRDAGSIAPRRRRARDRGGSLPRTARNLAADSAVSRPMAKRGRQGTLSERPGAGHGRDRWAVKRRVTGGNLTRPRRVRPGMRRNETGTELGYGSIFRNAAIPPTGSQCDSPRHLRVRYGNMRRWEERGSYMYDIPETGFLRLSQVLSVIPLGKTSWWEGVKSGRFPKPIKLSARCTAWRAEDIRDLIKNLSNQSN